MGDEKPPPANWEAIVEARSLRYELARGRTATALAAPGA